MISRAGLGKFFALVLLLGTSRVLAQDASTAFAGWSAFEKADLDKLAAGKILTHARGSTQFSHGVSGQAIYFVPAPLEFTADTLFGFDPSRHPEKSVHQFRRHKGEADAGFDTFTIDGRTASVRRFLAALSSGEGLHFSPLEAAAAPRTGSVEDAQKFCSGLMRARWAQAALHGDFGGTAHSRTQEEFLHLLAEDAPVARHFEALLSPLSAHAAPAPAAMYYWDFADVNRTAAIELGALYPRAAEGRRQLLDVVYYASSGYLASITLHELVPATLGGKPGTLAWQGTFVSSEMLAGAFGVKRKVASLLMASDLEQLVRIFRSDVVRRSAGP